MYANCSARNFSGCRVARFVSTAVFLRVLLDGNAIATASPESPKASHGFLGLTAKGEDRSAAVMAKFTAIMAASQLQLQTAQAHHMRAVSDAREQLKGLLAREGGQLAKAVAGLTADLRKAEAHLQAAEADARQALAARGASSEERWDSEESKVRARFQAQLSTADRVLGRAKDHDQLRIQEAVERGDDLIDDSTGKLSLRVGDLSELTVAARQLVDATQSPPAVLDGDTKEPTAAATALVRSAAVAAGGETATSTASLASQNLTSVGAALVAALQRVHADGASAEKKFDAALAKIQQDALVMTKSVKDRLDAAESKERQFQRSHAGKIGHIGRRAGGGHHGRWYGA
eukprot:TRINITY_DN2410_c0_g1_i7.p1 TRINITY_DN2410_c0_g1~~TRINITY_DN2410_c0_g1_i7.p1  ORF type:complete len:347 (+),score=72.31 TRINITY_DN2410_c0_g1_i7:75-1115(+)